MSKVWVQACSDRVEPAQVVPDGLGDVDGAVQILLALRGSGRVRVEQEDLHERTAVQRAVHSRCERLLMLGGDQVGPRVQDLYDPPAGGGTADEVLRVEAAEQPAAAELGGLGGHG